MLTLAGDVQPAPDFAKRVGNSDKQRGETVGAFKLWPTARPAIDVDRGESFKFALRIRPASGSPSELQLSTKPAGQIDYKLRRETKGSGYWLDISAGPFSDSGPHSATIELHGGDGPMNAVKIQLTVNVLSENIVASPASLDMGELLLSSLRAEPRYIGRVGIRKLTGAFRITAISSSLQFITLEQQTIVEGSNYLIRLKSDPARPPKAGSYNGLLLIETDDSQKPRVQVPIRLTVVDR